LPIAILRWHYFGCNSFS